LVQAKLPPCQHFENLVQRSGTARQQHHGVAVHEHDFFALVHGFGDDIAGQIDLADLPGHQVRGDHAKGIATRRLRGPRHGAHQPDIARAVHQPPVVFRQRRAQSRGLFGIFRVIAGARAAENTDRFQHGSPQGVENKRGCHCLAFDRC
tara:strand:+ start:1622 stop:2068 length:447 start_codon:yes stop_codon:yes gene_type:complete